MVRGPQPSGGTGVVVAGAVFFERAAYFYRATIRVGEFMRGLTNLIQHRRWAEALITRIPGNAKTEPA